MSLTIKSARQVYVGHDGTEHPIDTPAREGSHPRVHLLLVASPTLIITFDDGREASIGPGDLELLLCDNIPLIPLGLFEFVDEVGEYVNGRNHVRLRGHTGDPQIVKMAKQFVDDLMAETFTPKILFKEGHEL